MTYEPPTGFRATYASVADYKAAYPNVPGSDEQIGGALAAASRYIEQHANRVFNTDGELSQRTFEADTDRWTSSIFVDDFHLMDGDRDSGFEVEVWPFGEAGDGDSHQLDAARISLLPRNAAVREEPYTWLRARLGALGFRGAVAVTARWGWPSIPEPIKAATIEIAAIYRLETPRATNTVNELGVGTQMISSAGQRIIRDYVSEYVKREL